MRAACRAGVLSKVSGDGPNGIVCGGEKRRWGMDADKDESDKKDEKGPAVCVGGRSGRLFGMLVVVRVSSF